MKKLLILLFAILVAIPIFGYANDPDLAGAPVMVIDGRYGPVARYAFANNNAQTLQAIYTGGTPAGTWASGNYVPIGYLVCAETNGARFDPGGGTPAIDNNGLPLDANKCVKLYGVSTAGNTKFVNKTSGSNAVLQVAPIYSR